MRVTVEESTPGELLLLDSAARHAKGADAMRKAFEALGFEAAPARGGELAVVVELSQIMAKAYDATTARMLAALDGVLTGA